MRHFTAILLTTALLAVPAIAQQSNIPSPPSATATTAQLAEIRARMQALGAELGSLPQDSPRRKEIKEESARLSEQMRRYSDHTTPVTVRIPIDTRLVEISNRMSPDFGPEPMKGTSRRTFINHFADTVERDLVARGSHASISVDVPLAMVTITGPQWEVQEAKGALQEALPAYLERVQLLEAVELTSRDAQRLRRDQEQFIQRERSTVNINWEGGTLGALVKAVRSTVECNVVLAEPSVGTLVIPALSVNRVAPDVFFQSLQSIPLADDRQLAVTVVAPESKPIDGKSSALETMPVIVIAEKSRANPTSLPIAATQRIFDLSEWPGSDAAGIKKLIEAIDFAMQANGTAEQMKVRFHEPSRLLFAKGPSDSIRLVGEIVDAFRSKK